MNKLCIIAATVLLNICAAEDGTTSSSASSNRHRHAFYRSMEQRGGRGGADTRRVFGGSAAALREFPAACALLDARRGVRCSGAVLRAHWALTAAHCVAPHVLYVKYNTRRPAAAGGNLTTVLQLYRHPNYSVEQKDEGSGLDVTRLYHDVGLVRTSDAMTPAALDLRRHRLQLLYGEEVQVFGFGRTERSALGEELFAVRLRLVPCERAHWQHCVCGAHEQQRGVCSGDSGGPVVYRGSQIGVTSLGPTACARGAAAAGATSVFTALEPYADVVDATVHDAGEAVRMRVISRAPQHRGHTAALSALTIFVLLIGI